MDIEYSMERCEVSFANSEQFLKYTLLLVNDQRKNIRCW